MSEPRHLNPNQRAWRRFRRNRVARVCTGFLGALVFVLLVWPWLAHPRLAPALPRALTWSPVALSDAQFASPGVAHWCGTDVHGRDALSRVFFGARVSLLVGAVAAGVSLVIGVLWGAVAGYVGGRLDAVMMRLVDVLYSLPNIVFVIVLIATFEQPLQSWLNARGFGLSGRMILIVAGLGAISWLTMARIVRGQVLSLRGRGFVEASRALGAGHARLLFRHILPNISGIIITYVTLTIPSIILYESFLSYLGLGIQPPQASLGYLLADGANSINPIRIYWWLIVFPGGLLALTLLALSFVGDGLRDAWDAGAAEE